MKFLSRCVIVASAAVLCSAQAQDAQDINKATLAAQQWLAAMDGHDYASTWSGAAPAFREKVKQSDWEQSLNTARKPLGAVKSRNLKSATFARDLGGAPPGQYVIIVYDTRFANHAGDAIETVTPMRDSDGSWKVSGYYFR